MGLFDKLLGGNDKKQIQLLTREVKALQSNVIAQQISSITTRIYPTWDVWKDVETYRIMDEVSSVVKYLANIAAMIPMYTYDKATKEYLGDDEALSVFIESLTFDQRYVMYLNLYLFDECFIYKEIIEFGPNAGIKNIHFLHPQNMTLILSVGFPNQTIGYVYQDNLQGITLNFFTSEVIFIKGFNPTIDYQRQHRGQSPISLLCQTLTRLESGKSGSVAQLQNGGLPGVLFEKGNDREAWEQIEQKGTRDEKLQRFLRNQDNKGAPYTAYGDLGWLQMGLPLADMQVSELAKIDKDAIYNAYAVSNRLFNNDATGSEVSDKSARKSLYLDAIKPKVIRVQDAFNKYVVPDFKVKAYVKYDFSDIEVLQENLLDKANALAAAPVMIPNDILEAMGYERKDDPEMEKVFVKSGYQPLDDFIPVEDVAP